LAAIAPAGLRQIKSGRGQDRAKPGRDDRPSERRRGRKNAAFAF